MVMRTVFSRLSNSVVEDYAGVINLQSSVIVFSQRVIVTQVVLVVVVVVAAAAAAAAAAVAASQAYRSPLPPSWN